MVSEDFDSKEKVHKFMRSHVVAVLSMVTPDGKPYASPIYYIADEELNCYFLTKSDTKKANYLSLNTNAAITIVQSNPPVVIQSTGIVEEIEDPQKFTEMAHANASEKGGFSWPPPLSKLLSGGYMLMFKYKPNWMRVGDFTQSKDDSPKNIFHEIIKA